MEFIKTEKDGNTYYTIVKDIVDFDSIDSDIKEIKFMNKYALKLPDVSRFKNAEVLVLAKCSMTELHESIGTLENLELLVLVDNELKTLPKEIGLLKKLVFLNLFGNPIEDIPDEIKYLDKSNGGSLLRIAVKKEDIGEENYEKLKGLLPETIF